jgi:hypothetical protein
MRHTGPSSEICYSGPAMLVTLLVRSCLQVGTILFAISCTAPSAWSQQASPSPPPSAPATTPEFLATADEVLSEMSELTGWRLKTPLKKSIRSRAEIREYVLRQMDDEKDAKERYASERSGEAFGLLPNNFNLDSFLVDLLTEQIAGLYDPKTHEFYIADWIAPDEQRMVMSHELTHALQDQYFHIEAWVHAARPNDDAEMAREAVLEGSAMAGMLDYMLKDKGLKLRELPDVDPSLFVGDLSQTPMLKKAPPFIKDSLMFPYFSGLSFSMGVLRTTGWTGFASVFDRPPANTQQIMHPALYRANKAPAPLKVDLPDGVPGKDWNKLEENAMGEFGWKEILQQFLDEARAKRVAAGWDGDDYICFEQKENKKLVLATRVRFISEEMTSGFFAAYNDALGKKYPVKHDVNPGNQSVSFVTEDGAVEFRCVAKECISLEGADRAAFSQWEKKLNWPPVSAAPQKDETKPTPTDVQTRK